MKKTKKPIRQITSSDVFLACEVIEKAVRQYAGEQGIDAGYLLGNALPALAYRVCSRVLANDETQVTDFCQAIIATARRDTLARAEPASRYMH